MVDPFKLGGDGDREDKGETSETLKKTFQNLDDFEGKDGVLVSMSKQQLSILKQMINAPEHPRELTEILLICDFLSEGEADDELTAFYEAKRLGMDTQFNIDHALSRAAINRKGHRTSRAAMVMDTMSHYKYTGNAPKGNYERSSSPRSPLSY